MPPTSSLSYPPPRTTALTPTLLISGAPNSGKRTLASAVIHPVRQPCSPLDHHELRVRTRESVVHDSSAKRDEDRTQASEGDYLALVVDSTRAGALAALRETFEVLPVRWWGSLAVVVTKVDVRSARAFDPVAVRELVQEYTGSTSVPVLFCSLASLAPTASRLRSVVLSSSTDAFRPLKNLERCSSPVVNFGADSERSGRGTAAAGE